MTTAAIRLYGLDSLPGAVPALLGFHPQESLVLLCVRADRHLGPAVRADLPVADPHGLARIAARHAAQVILLTYTDGPRPDLAPLTAALGGRRVPIAGQVHTGNRPHPVAPAVAAAAAEAGRAVLASRAEMAASIAHHPAADDAAAAPWLARMTRVTGRDAAIAEHISDPGAVLPGLIAAAQATPDGHPACAHLCAALAVLAYRQGDGALANAALDRALAAQPGHRLARLLRTAFNAAIPPDELAALAHPHTP